MSDDTQSNGKLQTENFLDRERSAGSNRGAGSVTLSRTASIVVIAVSIVYVAALLLLFVNKAGGQWDRVVYVLSGYEAVGFVAVGAIFRIWMRSGAAKPTGMRAGPAPVDVFAGTISRLRRGRACVLAGLVDSPFQADR